MARKAPPKLSIKYPDFGNAILLGDPHIRTTTPKCRTDDFVRAMLLKLAFIRDLQVHLGCSVLCPGDIFDKYYLDKGEQWILTEIMPMIKDWVVIPGQHDLPQHNIDLLFKSALAVLEQAGCVHLIKTPYKEAAEIGMIGRKRIALIHKLTYLDKPPFPGAEKSGGTAKTLMKKMKGFDLIVSGDNHETFTYEKSGSLLVNPGSMMRTSAKQADHEPCVFVWTAETNSTEKVLLPFKKDVISREHIDKEKERDERISAFVEHLKGEVDLDLSFRDNVLQYMQANKTPRRVKDIILEVIE